MSTLSGTIYTFYSYKGGAGRSMALANCAALLSKWGYSVLVVDWDLEAPGLQRFFQSASSSVRVNESLPGVVDLIESQTTDEPLDWMDCLQHLSLNGSDAPPISFISSGRSGHDYTQRLQSLNFEDLFDRHDLGAFIEDLRLSWKAAMYDFVLVDSRTGFTDIGGICTVHLADILVLVFTSTDSSIEGSLDVVNRARAARQRLPVDREKLLVLPVPSRDESRTEYEQAARWKGVYVEKFGFLYKDWVPSESLIPEAIEQLRIPYVPYWSFGERLPVLEENGDDPGGISRAYEIVSRLLAQRLDWTGALTGRILPAPPRATRRSLDDEWSARSQHKALHGLESASKRGFVEIYHACLDVQIDRDQKQLLDAARQAITYRSRFLVGAVLDRDGARPTPINEGIVAEFTASLPPGTGSRYTYWALTKRGDFYSLMSLYEDNRADDKIFFETRILEATEALLHCQQLYRALGVKLTSTVAFRLTYGGLLRRNLASSETEVPFQRMNRLEDRVSSEVTFRLDLLEAQLVDLVDKLCKPLFMLFDFFEPPPEMYERYVQEFTAGRVSF